MDVFDNKMSRGPETAARRPIIEEDSRESSAGIIRQRASSNKLAPLVANC